ncbi:MAG: AMP-binding protein, partial [Sphingomicrobium sp.]
ALVIPSNYKGFDYPAMANAIHAPNVFAIGGSFDAAVRDHAPAGRRNPPPDADASRAILFTSGTESRPKGVVHSYNTLFFGMKRHVEQFGLGPDDVVMCVSPVGHGTGAVNGVEFALHLGATLVLEQSWSPQTGLASMARHGATMMWGATTFYTDLVEAAADADQDLPAFRLAFTAGAPVPRELVGLVRERLGATLIAAYGQSEGQNISITRLDDPPAKIAGSDGRFHDGIDWQLRGPNGEPVAPGEEGEIAYRGANVCLGYLDPAHTAAAFDTDGFIASGDIGRVDADGYLRIVGRAKDIIIRGGENISPAEVEDLLFGHPMIEQVSVIGYRDPRLGQRACAVVVPRPGTRPELADLTAHMAARKVAKFKYPERILLIDALPMTASGKVRKDVLRALLERQPA